MSVSAISNNVGNTGVSTSPFPFVLEAVLDTARTPFDALPIGAVETGGRVAFKKLGEVRNTG